MCEETSLGRIQVSREAIASIASEAVLSCYGVVGMSAATLRDGIAEILQVDSYHRGVEVEVVDDEIVIDLYVVVEYGTRISEVAHNVMESVKFSVEKALGMRVAKVNVHVQGLRVSDDDE
ncbi:MAG: Asp23/Gls24 family envelope stress response protein [Anaerolineales bacterium]